MPQSGRRAQPHHRPVPRSPWPPNVQPIVEPANTSGTEVIDDGINAFATRGGCRRPQPRAQHHLRHGQFRRSPEYSNREGNSHPAAGAARVDLVADKHRSGGGRAAGDAPTSRGSTTMTLRPISDRARKLLRDAGVRLIPHNRIAPSVGSWHAECPCCRLPSGLLGEGSTWNSACGCGSSGGDIDDLAEFVRHVRARPGRPR